MNNFTKLQRVSFYVLIVALFQIPLSLLWHKPVGNALAALAILAVVASVALALEKAGWFNGSGKK
jgi:hypothetical protein